MLAAAMAATVFASNGAQALDTIEMVAFGLPSPGVCKTEYDTGQFKAGGSAAALQIALSDTRGVPSTYLFNIFDFWGMIVSFHRGSPANRRARRCIVAPGPDRAG